MRLVVVDSNTSFCQRIQDEARLAGDIDVVAVAHDGALGYRHIREHAPHVEIVLADPEGSILAPYINTGEMIQSSSWLVEGIGEDFLPPISDFTRVKKAYAIGDKESFLTARELLEKEGILKALRAIIG
ncbi:MAG: hypothetical protein LOD91_02720 [Limnochordales bacterium]